MTRFEKELSGQLGEFWVKEAQKRIEKIEKDIECGQCILENGTAHNYLKNSDINILKRASEVITNDFIGTELKELIIRLENKKELDNNKTYEAIKAKRESDPNYARSKTEIENKKNHSTKPRKKRMVKIESIKGASEDLKTVEDILKNLNISYYIVDKGEPGFDGKSFVISVPNKVEKKTLKIFANNIFYQHSNENCFPIEVEYITDDGESDYTNISSYTPPCFNGI